MTRKEKEKALRWALLQAETYAALAIPELDAKSAAEYADKIKAARLALRELSSDGTEVPKLSRPALVVYFKTTKDRREFVEMWKSIHKGHESYRYPEGEVDPTLLPIETVEDKVVRKLRSVPRARKS